MARFNCRDSFDLVEGAASMFSRPAAAIHHSRVGDHHHYYRGGGRWSLRNSARSADAAVVGNLPFVRAFQEAQVPNEGERVAVWSRHADRRALFRSVCILHPIVKVKPVVVEADVKYADWRGRGRHRRWHKSRHFSRDGAWKFGRCRRWISRRRCRGGDSRY